MSWNNPYYQSLWNFVVNMSTRWANKVLRLNDCNSNLLEFVDPSECSCCIRDIKWFPKCKNNTFLFNGVCWTECSESMQWLTIAETISKLWLSDNLVKADPTDPVAKTLFEKVDTCTDDPITISLDVTNPNDHKVKRCFDKSKLRLKLTDLVDGPSTYANCNTNNIENEEWCDCGTSECWGWILASKCDNSWWEWVCPENNCSTSPCFHPNTTQMLTWTQWVWANFICAKKKEFFKVKWNDNAVDTFNGDIVSYASRWWTAYYQSNFDLTTIDVVDLTWYLEAESGHWLENVPAYRVKCDGRWSYYIKGSVLTNRWIHTIRNQLMVLRADTGQVQILLDDRFEWTVFKKQSTGDDNYIWVDNITDLNSFCDDFPLLTDNERMEAWLWRTLRWHWFWQSWRDFFKEGDLIFYVYKIQSLPVWEEPNMFTAQIAFVWEANTTTWWVGSGTERWFKFEDDRGFYLGAWDVFTRSL